MKSIVFPIIISIGLAFLGYFSAKQISSGKELIEVKGLSERIVRADSSTTTINIEYKDQSPELTQKKLSELSDIVLKDLKKLGVEEKEISINNNMYERSEEEYSDNKKVTKKSFCATTSIIVESKNVEIPVQIEKLLPSWFAKNMVVNCSKEYRLSDFNKLKKEMMREAALNAKEVAMDFIQPFGESLGELVYLNQGMISLSSPTSNYEYEERKSVDKKLRLVIKAGFRTKAKM